MVKKLFKGTFNWYGEVHILHTHAVNNYKALINFMVQLGVELQRSQISIRRYFNDGVDRWKIEEVIKDED